MNTPGHNTHQSIKILAFDTSGDEASLALWADGKMEGVSLPFGTGPHSHAAQLLTMMQELLRGASLDFQDINVIATPAGPGSFTGIRLGLATAQGLVLSTKARSFVPTTFQVFAFGAWKERVDSGSPLDASSAGPCLVTLGTKRDSFYTQAFGKAHLPLGKARIQTEGEIQDFLALNSDVYRVDRLSLSSAQHLIYFYLWELKTHPQLLLESRGLLRPYYVHNPEFVKQKQCSL